MMKPFFQKAGKRMKQFAVSEDELRMYDA